VSLRLIARASSSANGSVGPAAAAGRPRTAEAGLGSLPVSRRGGVPARMWLAARRARARRAPRAGRARICSIPVAPGGRSVSASSSPRSGSSPVPPALRLPPMVVLVCWAGPRGNHSPAVNRTRPALCRRPASRRCSPPRCLLRRVANCGGLVIVVVAPGQAVATARATAPAGRLRATHSPTLVAPGRVMTSNPTGGRPPAKVGWADSSGASWRHNPSPPAAAG